MRRGPVEGTTHERKSGNFALILMVLSLGMLATLGCDPERAEAVRLYNEGMSTYNAGSTSEAVELMQQALEEDPTFVDAAYTMGQIYQQRLGDLEEAARSYRRALDHEPDDARFAYRLASVLAEQENYEEAIDFFDRAIANDETYSRAWFEKGMSQEALGLFSEAVESYTRAIETNPRLRMTEEDVGGEHYHSLADLYLRFRLYDHAVQVYDNGVRNNPASTRLSHGLGVSLMELERFGEAVEAFEKTLEADSNHGSANFNIAVAYHESGDTDSAIEQLDDLVTRGGTGMTEPRRQAVEALLEDLRAENDE